MHACGVRFLGVTIAYGKTEVVQPLAGIPSSLSSLTLKKETTADTHFTVRHRQCQTMGVGIARALSKKDLSKLGAK